MAQIRKSRQKSGVVTLKVVAQHVGLTPGTVSAVLNNAPSSRSIPQETKNRIHAAAQELDYRPNFFARTLRNKRTYTIGVTPNNFMAEDNLAQELAHQGRTSIDRALRRSDITREAVAGQDRSEKQNQGMGHVAIDAQRLPPNVPFSRPGRESQEDRNRPSLEPSNTLQSKVRTWSCCSREDSLTV